MKMLFFSSNELEVEQISKEFSHAGIRCEVRHSPAVQGLPPNPTETELWIKDDRDCHRALMLCVQLGMGFAKRPRQTFDLETGKMDDLEEDLKLSRA